MGVIGGHVGYWILRRIRPGGDSGYLSGEADANKSKLTVLLGTISSSRSEGGRCLDFGCGTGGEAVEMAQRGARRVIGADIRERWLEAARRHAEEQHVTDRCSFTTAPDHPADIVLSIDSFEHYDDPAEVLRVMESYLAPGGRSSRPSGRRGTTRWVGTSFRSSPGRI